jgi:hypothetical protein
LREDCKGFGALRRTYFALVCTGAVGNSLAFVLTLHTVSTGRVVEASPHLGELMSYPYTAWLLGQSIFLGLYVTVFFAPGLTMHQRVVIAASITGLSLEPVPRLNGLPRVALPAHHCYLDTSSSNANSRKPLGTCCTRQGVRYTILKDYPSTIIVPYMPLTICDSGNVSASSAQT